MGANAVRLEIVNLSVVSIEQPSIYAPAAENAADRTVVMNKYALDDIFDENTDPAPSEALALEIEIDNTGSYELDLTAAPIVGALSSGVPAATETLAGKRLMHLELETSGNAAAITVKPSSSNGYDLFGASIADGIKLETTDKWGRTCQSSTLPEVGATAKGITFEGTEDDTINVLMVFE